MGKQHTTAEHTAVGEMKVGTSSPTLRMDDEDAEREDPPRIYLDASNRHTMLCCFYTVLWIIFWLFIEMWNKITTGWCGKKGWCSQCKKVDYSDENCINFSCIKLTCKQFIRINQLVGLCVCLLGLSQLMRLNYEVRNYTCCGFGNFKTEEVPPEPEENL